MQHLPLEAQRAWKDGDRSAYLKLLHRYGALTPEDPEGTLHVVQLGHPQEENLCWADAIVVPGVGPLFSVLRRIAKPAGLETILALRRHKIEARLLPQKGDIWKCPEVLGLRTREEVTKFLLNLPNYELRRGGSVVLTLASELEYRVRYLDPDRCIQFSTRADHLIAHTPDRPGVILTSALYFNRTDWIPTCIRHMQEAGIIDPSIRPEWAVYDHRI